MFAADTTTSYRLNIFGFPGYPQSSANLGILDQRLAIEWVRDNIEAFGGDPSRMILFGQSAGAGSTDIHSYAFAEDPIVKGFILESGTDGLRDGSNDTSGTAWFGAAALLGCSDNSTTPDPATVAACMETKPATDVLAASSNFPFGPVEDGKIVFTDYPSRVPAALPVLLGSNDNEAGIFEALSPNAPPSEWTEQNLEFTCGAANRAAYSLQNGNPTWRYRWFGDFPNTQISYDPPSGAWHGSEVSNDIRRSKKVIES
jgi:carboxylesterase type B